MNITEQSTQTHSLLQWSLHARRPLVTTKVKQQHLPIQEHYIQNETNAVRALLPHVAGTGR